MTANEVLKKIKDETAYLEYSLTMVIDEIRIPRIGKVVVLAQELKKFCESLTEGYENSGTPLQTHSLIWTRMIPGRLRSSCVISPNC